MAKYRFVHTAFWNDPKVIEDFSPEDRLVYIYLLTNDKTSQIGIYQITKKQIAFETGISVESIGAILNRFEHHLQLIQYDEETKEIILENWARYNLNKGGKPIEDCIRKELKAVKSVHFLVLMSLTIQNEPILNLFRQELDNRNFYDEPILNLGEPIFEPNEPVDEPNLNLDEPWIEPNEPLENLDLSTFEPNLTNRTTNRHTNRTTISGQKEKEKEKKDIVHFEPNEPPIEPINEPKKGSKKSSSSKNEIREQEFELFWRDYPRKEGKKPAFEKFKTIRKKYELELILRGSNGYKMNLEKEKTESKYIKHAKTFLHQESFLDYLEPKNGSNEPQNSSKRGSKIKEWSPEEEERKLKEVEEWTNMNENISTNANGWELS